MSAPKPRSESTSVPAVAGDTPSAQVDLADAASDTPASTPRMPHERDEAVGSTDGAPSERVRQGARDLKRGVQDTSRAAEADRAYDKLKK